LLVQFEMKVLESDTGGASVLNALLYMVSTGRINFYRGSALAGLLAYCLADV